MSTQAQKTFEKPVLSTKQKIFHYSLIAVLIHLSMALAFYNGKGRMLTLNDLKEIPILWHTALPWGLSRWFDVLICPICAVIYFPINADPIWKCNNRGLFMGLFSGVVCLFFLGYFCGIVTGLFYGVCIGLAMAWIGHED